MSSQYLKVNRGPFICHAHLAANVNNPLIAVCMIPHMDMDEAWDCRSRSKKNDPYGTRYHWSTCRLEFCHADKQTQNLVRFPAA